MDAIEQIYAEAMELEACELFTGRENFDDLIVLLLSPQGLEFCTKHNFPSIEHFEMFNQQMLEAKGIFVNSGEILIKNKKQVLLVGDTEAVCEFKGTKHAFQVVLLHGATAHIKAEEYAVVTTLGDTTNLLIHAKTKAIVI